MTIRQHFRIVIGVFGALVAHTLEIWLFASAYYFLPYVDGWGNFTGEFNGSFMDCVYFSYTTFTTLGFGDIQPHGLIRHLVGIESLTVLLLITWTASFLYFEMQRYWDRGENSIDKPIIFKLYSMQTVIHIKGENMINLIRNIIALGVVALAFTACSTMNKSECINADWDTIGYGDGTNGYPASRISQHRSACAEHGIKPNLNAYTNGRNKGLNQYCIPSRGYYKGLAGSRYNGVCTNHNEATYLDAFNYGTAVYKEVKILDNLKREYSSEEHHIRQLERSLQHKEHEMINGKISKLKAYKLLQETKEMAEELGKAKLNLGNLAGNIDHQAGRISDMKRGRSYN